MTTTNKGLGRFELSSAATGSPIRFYWSGTNFLTAKEAQTTVKQLTTLLNKVQPKTKKTTKKTKRNGRR
jgi:hypothetical protein